MNHILGGGQNFINFFKKRDRLIYIYVFFIKASQILEDFVCKQDIENFVIVGFKSASRGVKSVRCLTGESAILARENGVLVCEDILSYQVVYLLPF